MDSAWNLDCMFKLLFQDQDHRNIDELISLIDSRREKTRVHNNGDDISNRLEKVLGSLELLLKIFNNNYETRFDVFIEYIFDQIQNIIQFGIDRNILSNLPLENIINLIDLVLDISISHSCEGILTKLAKFYTCMLNVLKSGDFPLSEVEELILNLRILSNFYVIINKKKSENLMENTKHLITVIKNDGYESELFAKLVVSGPKVIATQTLINVIPVYMKFSGNNIILQLIWDKISQSLAGNNYEFSRVFIVLCYLSDVYFAAENKKLIHDIFECNCYWALLQKGLIHSDSCVRKQALFLLKKSCHYLKDNQISCIKQEGGVSNMSQTSEKCNNLLKCDWNVMFDVFSELWCIIEYLEETQIHLLKPIIDVIDSFITRNMGILDISWKLIIIQRMISHNNMTIIKKGFSNMLNIQICYYHNDEILADAAKLLVSALKCTQLYSLSWQVVVDELKMYFDACSRQGNGKEFFTLLINEIANVRWGPEALFFVTYALQSVEPKNYWGRHELDLIKKILNGTVNHYTYMKSATQGQLLSITFNFLASHDVTLDDVASLVTCSVKNTCLMRNNNLWKKIVKWVRDSYETEDVEKYLKKSISDHTESVNIGKMILILNDAHSDNREMTQKITNSLTNILVTFADVHVRPYFDAGTQEFYLSIVCDFMEESSGDCPLMNIFRPLVPDILKYIEIKLNSSHHIKDFEQSQDVLRRLETIFNFCKSDHAALEVVNKWFEKIITNLIIEPVGFLPLQKFLQIKTLTILVANNVCLVSHPEMEFVGPFLKSGLCAPLEKTAEDSTVTEDLQKLWGKMNTEYLKRKWELLSYVTGSPVDVLQISNSDFIRLCLDAIDTGGAAVLLPVLSTLRKVLPSLLQEPQLTQMMDSIFNVMMERKKNDDFYQLVQAYIEITFQLNVINTKEENVRGMLLEHSRQLFSENNVNIANAIIKHVQKLKLITEGKYFLLDLLPRALLFGQVQRKDERLISDICTIIEKENISPLTNDFSTSVEVRARAINIVLTLKRRCEDDREFAEDLIDALIKFEENINKNKTRYFADSNVHRYKERLMQSLLVLVDLISQLKSSKLWTWVFGKLLENNQPSVRYMQEWLMLRLICNHPSLEDRIWLYFDECKDKTTRSLCSFISVAYHSLSLPAMPAEKEESRIGTAMRIFLPYCMAQHFSVRLYAQVTLQKLTNFMKASNFKSVREKYGVVSEILSESIRSGNAVKNCSKMLEDFYFTEFSPASHYTLETIFYEFPRLTSAGSQELIPVSLFKKYGLDEENCIIPVKNLNDSLSLFKHGKWIVDGSNQFDIFPDSEENKEIELSNFQKKMIPTKYLVPDVEELLQFLSYSADDKNKDGLIVVGSLIDRLPNLGGLSRTCEVFGASEFVIGSLKYLEDQQFKSLSVTAEKWIPITEVKPYHLSEYLTKMKLNGYTILAAEQTVNSQPLGSVKFPKKSILLLGNEKEGIPPTLLPLTDVCVEIPQKGIIRSLNVHVTGALFIWEYAKQHNSFTGI